MTWREDNGKFLAYQDKEVPRIGPNTAFPVCTDMLVSAVEDSTSNRAISGKFKEYFSHVDIVPVATTITMPVSKGLRNLLHKDPNDNSKSIWPVPECLPHYHLELNGDRYTSADPLKRLFIADLVWLYYHEKMGSFRVIGAVMDDYEGVGKYTLEAIDPSSLILESMVRSRRMGVWPSPEDREGTYLRSLGWPQGSPVRAEPNAAFGRAFFDLIRLVLRFYSEYRFSTIFSKSTTTPTATSTPQATSTISTISTTPEAVFDLVTTLYRTFSKFDFGRNYSNTLSGLVWCIGGLGLVDYLHMQKRCFGVSSVPSDDLEDYFPALHDALLGAPKGGPSLLVSPYLNCAKHARDILLDVQVIGERKLGASDVTAWLTDPEVQGSFEGFGAAHRSLPSDGTPAEWKL